MLSVAYCARPCAPLFPQVDIRQFDITVNASRIVDLFQTGRYVEQDPL